MYRKSENTEVSRIGDRFQKCIHNKTNKLELGRLCCLYGRMVADTTGAAGAGIYIFSACCQCVAYMSRKLLEAKFHGERTSHVQAYI